MFSRRKLYVPYLLLLLFFIIVILRIACLIQDFDFYTRLIIRGTVISRFLQNREIKCE